MSSTSNQRSRLLLSIAELTYLLGRVGGEGPLVRRVLPFPLPEAKAEAQSIAEALLQVRLLNAGESVSAESYVNALSVVVETIQSARVAVQLAVHTPNPYSVVVFAGAESCVELAIRADSWVEIAVLSLSEVADYVVSERLSFDYAFDLMMVRAEPGTEPAVLVYSDRVLTNGELQSTRIDTSAESERSALDAIRSAMAESLSVLSTVAHHG